CLLQPSGWRLPRRVAGRRAVRAHRLLRRGLVALDPARPLVGGDQPADRREAGGATGAGLTPMSGPGVVTGGVGSVAIAILRHRGFQVTAVIGRPEQVDIQKSLGASEIIERKELAGPAKPLGKARWAGDRLDHARPCAFDDALRRGGGGLGGGGGGGGWGRWGGRVVPWWCAGASRLGIGSVMRPMADGRMA